MKNINKITYLDIKNIFNIHKVAFKSNLKDDDEFTLLNSISHASNQDLTFFSNISQFDFLKKTSAKACLINEEYVDHLPDGTIPILVDNTYNAFAIVSNLFKKKIKSNNIISDNSFIHKNTVMGNNIQIDSFSVIKENCKIGNNVIIESNCSIGPNVTILDDSTIHSNTTLLYCSIGINCVIKPGAIIGGVGFGFDPVSKNKIQHIGDVIIENNCHIGSNTTIDRAVFDSTIISENSFIDNLVQIAHNVVVGKAAIIAAQSGIAGSSVIGDNVVIGGQAGISGHLKIGNNVRIAAKSGVTKNIKNNSVIAGFPAIDIKKWKLIKIKETKQL